MMTASMAWMTPLAVSMSVATSVAPLILTVEPLTSKRTALPWAVVACKLLEISSAMVFPSNTWYLSVSANSGSASSWASVNLNWVRKAVNAASVGAKIVYGPGPANRASNPVVSSALVRLLKLVFAARVW